MLQATATPAAADRDDVDDPANFQPEDYGKADIAAASEETQSSRYDEFMEELDALDDLHGLHNTDGPGGDSGEDLDALDNALQRDAREKPSVDRAAAGGGRNSASGRLEDDGFAALDDLLGLDDGSGIKVDQATNLRATAGEVHADSYAASNSPVAGDDLWDGQPTSGAKPAAKDQPTDGGVWKSPELDSSASSGDWLDDILNADDDGSFAQQSKTAKVSNGGIPSSDYDDQSWQKYFPHLDGNAPAKGGRNTDPARKNGGSNWGTGSAAPTEQSLDSIEDWLGGVLSEYDDDQSAGSSSKAKRGGSDDGGGLSDVITGSSALEDWKSPTAPVRSNVMGTGGRKGKRGPIDDSGEVPRPGRNRGRGDGGRTRDYPESRSSGSDEWDGYSRGTAGRRRADYGDSYRSTGSAGWEDPSPGGGWDRELYEGDEGAGMSSLDPTRDAQQAVVDDLKMLGRRGRWQDALTALVGAKVRGVPINASMYNT